MIGGIWLQECRSSGNKAVALPAGAFQLEVTTDIARNTDGTYSFKGVLS